jgi:hypothetical protein
MLSIVKIISKTKTQIILSEIESNKIALDCSEIIRFSNSFDIAIEFTSDIIAFRNHDYTWVSPNYNVATEYSPKIIKLNNGFYVQANICAGIWEVNSKYPKILYWRFNANFSKPLTVYSGEKNSKIITEANSSLDLKELPALLFSNTCAVEFSRSAIPFSSAACFTDHCDFDTLENLKVQRDFFKKQNIKVTKGFFLNHFSKRQDNASWQNNQDEILKWHEDGHELCYHSLSQSIKSNEDSFADFKNFVPPFNKSLVWIDHGYQPYNFSLFQNSKIDSKIYATILKEKNIKLLWNYIDSGTATNGVINQLNPNHFTLQSFLKGNKSLGNIKRFQALVKTIVFHFLSDDKTITLYKATAQMFKKILYQSSLRTIPLFLITFAKLLGLILPVFFSWKTNKKKPFRLAKYSPLLFKHTIDQKQFAIFQTVEMIDFTSSLAKENIDLLIEESGIFIAHTYFSDSIVYHNGKLLTESNTVDINVSKNFDYLARKIIEKQIWNPTLSQLYHYFEDLNSLVFDVDKNGCIFVKNKESIAVREVQ